MRTLNEVRQRTDFRRAKEFPAGYRRTQQRCQKRVLLGNTCTGAETPGRVTPVHHLPNRSERRHGPDGILTEYATLYFLNDFSKRLITQIQSFFPRQVMASPTIDVQSDAAEAGQQARHGLTPRIRNGNKGQLHQT